MGLRDYIQNKRLNRLESDLKMLNSKYNFNPMEAFREVEENIADRFTRKIEEYRIWASGDAYSLKMLYKGSYIENTLNYFWRKAPMSSMMKHSGIPSLISTKMAQILFGQGIQVDAQVYEGDQVNEKRSAEVEEFIHTLYDKCKMDEKFQNGAINESWGGHIFYKYSYDLELSNYPILEVADITQARLIKERGITTAIVFPEYFKEGGRSYRLDEIYTTDDNGDAVIEYKLFVLNGEKEKECGLSETIRSSELEEIYTFKGIKGLLAFEKPNRTPSLLFPRSPYGRSDYEGSIDGFDALDESYTDIFKELRSNRTIRYIPENMIPKDKNGKVLLDEFTDSYQKVNGDIDQDADNKIQCTIIPDKTDEHKAKYLTALTNVLNNAGLSPFAIGLTGLESVNASAESQQERNKCTLETRKAKLKLWQPMIEELLIRGCELNDWLLENTNAQQDYRVMDVDWDNLTIRVSFGDYIVDNESTKISNLTSAMSGGLISTERAVKELHPEWDDIQVLEEVNKIRFEKGFVNENPLGLPELNGIAPKEDEE